MAVLVFGVVVAEADWAEVSIGLRAERDGRHRSRMSTSGAGWSNPRKFYWFTIGAGCKQAEQDVDERGGMSTSREGCRQAERDAYERSGM